MLIYRQKLLSYIGEKEENQISRQNKHEQLPGVMYYVEESKARDCSNMVQ